MPDIKLILTDFDGTVAEFGKHEVSDKVRQAVIDCTNKGVHVVPVTGRYYEMARPILELLGFSDLGVFDNGASIRNCVTGELIWSNWLEPDVVQKIASVLAPAANWIDYTEDHDEHVPADNELDRITLVESPTSHVYALVLVAERENIEAQLSKISGITWYFAPDTHGSVDYIAVQVTHKEADKFHGAEALRDLIGIAKDNTLAIGDGDNDIPLFDNAALKLLWAMLPTG